MRAGLLIATGVLIPITTRWNRWGGERTLADHRRRLLAGLIFRRWPRKSPATCAPGRCRITSGYTPANFWYRIVDDDYKATVDQLTAGVQAAAATVEALKAQHALQGANVQAAKATIAANTANLDQNDRDLKRQQRLLQTGSSSTEQTEKLQTTHAQLSAQLDQNRAQELAAARQLDVLAAQEQQAEAALAGQKASLELAKINLGYTSIIAPQDGVIGQRQVKPGQFVPVGGQVTSLTPLPNVWVIANYKETQLTHMKAGQKAEIRVDTFSGSGARGTRAGLRPRLRPGVQPAAPR